MVGRGEPHSAVVAGNRIEYGRVEVAHTVSHFFPAFLDLIAQAEIYGEIVTELDVILNKDLRTFLATAKQG